MKTFEWVHQGRTFHGLKSEVVSPKKGIIVIHGMGEHIGRYEGFFNALEASGIYAVGIDLRGHGKSLNNQAIGMLTPADTFGAMIEDLHALFMEESSTHTGLTWTLMGHSMGSLIARRYAQVYPDDYERMIWMGTLPLYGGITRKGFRILAGFFSLFYRAYARNQMLSKLMNQPLKNSIKDALTTHDWLSTNEKNVEEFIKDPLSGYAYNSRFYRQFFQLLDEVTRPSNIKKTQLKRLLLVAGKDDPVTQKGVSHQQILSTYGALFPALIIHDVQFDSLRHEVLNEKNPGPVHQRIFEEITHA